MKSLRSVILISAILGLSGCTIFDSYSEVKALNEAQSVGDPFTQTLAAEYRSFANEELHDMFDYPDALHFARKGLAAASGTQVLPEITADWNLEENHIRELSSARGYLMMAFDKGARQIIPEHSAIAQAAFDCWIEQQEEDSQSPDIESCKSRFTNSMNEIEIALKPKEEAVIEDLPLPVETKMPEPKPEVKPDPEALKDAMYLVFFNWDSYELGAGANSIVSAVKEEISKNNLARVSIVGHADTSGTENYNEKLAFKRATRVRDNLIQKGVDPAIIKIESRGEQDLMVSTSDNIKEPANRRVNISFN